MSKGKIGVLPETISVATAAEYLGGPQFVAELLHRIADGDLFSWTHSPASGPLREKTNHLIDTRESLPRIALDIPPETVLINTADLQGAFYHYELPWPPGTGKASSWDGATPLQDLAELVASRRPKQKRAKWTDSESNLLLTVYQEMGGSGKRGALAELAREFAVRGLPLASQSLRERIATAQKRTESSAGKNGARASSTVQSVWVLRKPNR